MKEHKKSVLNCCGWLKGEIEKLDLETEIWETELHPVIFAQDLSAGKDKPTLLLYNHYDVQPVDPLDLWETPPFEPTIRNGEVYARGAQDNKGQCFYVLAALQAYRKIHGKFPINIKWIIEGAEEFGSMGLPETLEQQKEKIQADYLAIVDVGIPSMNRPSLTLGVRGLITMDLVVKCANSDLHSGMEGGVAPNPIQIIADLIAKSRNSDGSIAIEGFYDGTSPLSEEDKKLLDMRFDEEAYFAMHNVGPHGGEKHLPPLERAWFRPTLEVNGILGGYTGDGFKTVIPAKAKAKISCRLVPGQDPKKIGRLVKEFFLNNAPNGSQVLVDVHEACGRADRTSPNTPFIKAAARAIEEIFQTPCRFILEGASIPISCDLANISGAKIAFLGLGLSSDHIHAPNEHFGINRIEMGLSMIGRTIELLGESA
jgi:acetylornithine deacetylase/succinyl-diaminopimelate desuccinylase-like protein